MVKFCFVDITDIYIYIYKKNYRTFFIIFSTFLKLQFKYEYEIKLLIFLQLLLNIQVYNCIIKIFTICKGHVLKTATVGRIFSASVSYDVVGLWPNSRINFILES